MIKLNSENKISEKIDNQIKSQPKEVIFCKKCVVSNQRPRIEFGEDGVCSACKFSYEKKQVIDWNAREEELKKLCDKHRRDDGEYDVIVPCSGGKDASAVAHKLKTKYNMHPLTVTWAPFRHTDIGLKNFNSFINSGFNNLLGYPNGDLHRKLSRIAFEALGDPWQPFTFGQMSYAFHIALKFDIKLVFFGENGEAEYGGSTKNNYKAYMPLEDWSDLYFKGVNVNDLIEWGKKKNLISEADYTDSDLTFYKPPSKDILIKKGIQMHWYSYYEKWVPKDNYNYASKYTGFIPKDGRTEGTYTNYASLDDKFDGFHYYLAFIKFGIGRATADAAHEMRDGDITREEAIKLVKKYDGEFPEKHFREFLDYLNITENKFWEIVDSYRPQHLWEKIDDKWNLKHKIY